MTPICSLPAEPLFLLVHVTFVMPAVFAWRSPSVSICGQHLRGGVHGEHWLEVGRLRQGERPGPAAEIQYPSTAVEMEVVDNALESANG